MIPVDTMILPKSFDAEDFLQNYWQKKPLLIRSSGAVFIDPISPEELAGLACEDFIESRLINCYPDDGNWKLRNGPFKEKDFLKLPDKNYTLLVQAVDQWHEDVRAMLKDFSFIPSWRIDDIMISYSTDGGNVGPHFDYYDVFLIQGLGQKKWQLGGHADSSSKLRSNKDLRLLAEFNTEQEYLLAPGDILYLPPNLAHWGIAIGNSMTYSVGFRTPSYAEIISELSDDIIGQLREDQRYKDNAPQVPQRPGEIPADALRQVQDLLLEQLNRPDVIAHWFGSSMTSPKYPDISVIVDKKLDAATLEKELKTGAQLYKNPAARFAFIKNPDKLQLFADGVEFSCDLPLLPLIDHLCASAELPENLLDTVLQQTGVEQASALLTILAKLHNQGTLLLDCTKPSKRCQT
jgi:50S ribosomal protein L16 3-hydroxylase